MTDFIELTEQLERVHTARLALRPIALCDAWPLFASTRNPEFNKNLLWLQPQDDVPVLDRIQTIMDVARRGGMTALSAVLKSTGEWVSLYRFQPYEADVSLVEMGIWTHEKFWKNRYSFELTQACIDAAFTLTDIPLLIGGASPDNIGSCRILERCGLKPLAVIHRHSETDVERKSQEFKITREEWLSQRSFGSFSYVCEAPILPNKHAALAGFSEVRGEMTRLNAENAGHAPSFGSAFV